MFNVPITKFPADTYWSHPSEAKNELKWSYCGLSRVKMFKTQ